MIASPGKGAMVQWRTGEQTWRRVHVMTIPERVQMLAAEFGPQSHESAVVFRVELERHLREVEREAREDCRRAARVRAETASATGDVAGARAAADVAAFIASGRVLGG